MQIGDKPMTSTGASAYKYDLDVLVKEQVETKHVKKDWTRLKKIYTSVVGNEEYLLKRPFDIGLSFLGILFSLPLWIMIA
ncbi:hypothetical protein MYX76_18655, partial [Desulfobacterota bacterium AH_259_B03_O07]|nr:hypothetical protein [Desulfobacterota bacterium AH_259_B03_O07]